MQAIGELAGLTPASQIGEEGESDAHDDMRVSTLRRIVEALGGELEIIAHLPNGRIAVSPFSEERKKTGAA